MKKLSKFFFLMFACGILISLCFGGVVSAKEYSGTEDTYSGTIIWTVDTTERTLMLEGKGTFDMAMGRSPWIPYLKDVDTIYISSGIKVYFINKSGLQKDTYQNVKIYKELESGFSWKFDEARNTITFFGKGDLPDDFQLNHSGLFDKIIISDDITGMGASYNTWGAETISLGKNVRVLPLDMRCAKISYEVDSANTYLTTYDQCLYSKQYDTLYACPEEKTSIKFPENVYTIKAWAFHYSKIRELIVPWSVTTIETSAFSVMGKPTTENPEAKGAIIVVPDGLRSISYGELWTESPTYTTIIYGKGNAGIAQAISEGKKNGHGNWDIRAEEVDSVLSYYDLETTQLNSHMGWVKKGSSWYYYDQSGKMATDLITVSGKKYYLDPKTGVMQHSKWQYADGNWYYLNTYGAGVTKYWALSGGKWFYLKEDGKMAKSQWIEWYGKWYYVGADGAMYVNRSTPDGRYVDGSGVRIR